MKSASLAGDTVICLWFALAALAFWAPYLGAALPAGPLNALYAVFLLTSIASLVLRLLRQNNPAGTEIDAVLPNDFRKEDALRRGR